MNEKVSYEDLLMTNAAAGGLLKNQDLPIKEVAHKLGISMERARRFRTRFLRENRIPIDPRHGGRGLGIKGNTKSKMANPTQFDEMVDELMYSSASLSQTMEKYGLIGKVSEQTMWNLRNKIALERGDLERKKRPAPAREEVRSLSEATMQDIEAALKKKNKGGESWNSLMLMAGLDMSVSSFRRYIKEYVAERQKVRDDLKREVLGDAS